MSKIPPQCLSWLAALAVLAATGCSPSTAAPSAPTPAPQPIVPFADRLHFLVSESTVNPVARVYGQDLEYSVCRTIQNLYVVPATATEVEVTVYGPAGELLVSHTEAPYERAMGYLSGYSGCRGSVRDGDRSHPIGTRYRVRFSVSYDDGMTGQVEGEAPVRLLQ